MTSCGLGEAWCLCEEFEGHDGPHVCACGGSWNFTPSDEFVLVELAGANPDYQAVIE